MLQLPSNCNGAYVGLLVFFEIIINLLSWGFSFKVIISIDIYFISGEGNNLHSFDMSFKRQTLYPPVSVT